MLLRGERATDAGAVSAVIVQAFADPHRHGHGEQVARLWADVRKQGLVVASLVGEDESGLLGHVGVSHAWLDARRELVDVLVLSPLSVRPDRQGQGIGTALVDAAVAAARESGFPALFLEGSPIFYGQRGFSKASELGFEAPSRRTPDPAFQVVLLPAHEQWMAGRVIYHDVWWAHDAAGLRDPALAEVEARFGGG